MWVLRLCSLCVAWLSCVCLFRAACPNAYSVKTVTTITETPSDDGTIQKMTRDVDLDITTTYATVDTYSDGSTTTTYSSTNTKRRGEV